MGKPYATELAGLAGTYEWAANCSVGELTKAICRIKDSSLYTVGSGGSLSAAAFWAMVHELVTGCLSKYGSPLDLQNQLSLQKYAVGLVSARGSNPDIVDSSRYAAIHESKDLIVLTLAAKSKVSTESESFSWPQVVNFDPPIKKDGFLATNSLLSTMVLLYRAYWESVNQDPRLPSKLVEPLITGSSPDSSRSTFCILYGGWAKIAAIDIESKLVEAALAGVQVADFRNFAHGRHHWLAKHGAATTVVALTTPKWKELSNRTLDLLPDTTQVIRIETEDDGPFGATELVVGGLRLIEQIANMWGVDPARPHVPDFGRRLYHLGVGTRRISKPSVNLLLNRKLGGPISLWPPRVIEASKRSLKEYLRILSTAKFKGIVFDYDGTLCPEGNRFGNLPPNISDALDTLLTHEIAIGVATGRGRSVGHSLRESLNRKYWDTFVVGYYTGAHILRLSEGDPDTGSTPFKSLVSFCESLKRQPAISNLCTIDMRPNQITITPESGASLTKTHQLVLELLAVEDTNRIFVTRSSHSVDVLGRGASKQKVVDAIRAELGAGQLDAPVLCIGDSGAWDGNDLQLLARPHSLSVGDCPANPSWAWNLARQGQRGPSATLEYINAMRFGNGHFLLDIERLVGKMR